jgi:hypothetical protein
MFLRFISFLCLALVSVQARALDPNDQQSLDLKSAVDAFTDVQDALNVENKVPCVTTTSKRRATKAQSCDEPSGPITANDSPNKAYFEDLLKRGMSAPISDFLKLWYPSRGDPKAQEKDPYFFSCESAAWDVLQPQADGFLSPNCKPDVLYSWGPVGKIKNMSTAMPDSKVWSGPPNPNFSLTTTLAPSPTFSYGLVQVRVRIKPSVQFSFSRNGPDDISFANTALIQFNVVNSETIESWSYGTPEQYDEIVRDILRITSGKRSLLLLAYAPPDITPSNQEQGFHRLYRGNGAETEGWDGHPGDEKVLKATLFNHIKMILNGEGRIIYSQGACRNRARFFQTDKPTYFNPVTADKTVP